MKRQQEARTFRLAGALGIVLGLAAATSASDGGPSGWSGIAAAIAGTLDQAAAAHAARQSERGVELVNEAYFDLFEECGLEIAVRRYVSVRRARELERMFGAIRDAIDEGAAPARVRRLVATLRSALRTEALALERQGVTPQDLRTAP
jgi:high-affinity iron transporter